MLQVNTLRTFSTVALQTGHIPATPILSAHGAHTQRCTVEPWRKPTKAGASWQMTQTSPSAGGTAAAAAAGMTVGGGIGGAEGSDGHGALQAEGLPLLLAPEVQLNAPAQ